MVRLVWPALKVTVPLGNRLDWKSVAAAAVTPLPSASALTAHLAVLVPVLEPLRLTTKL